MEEGNDQVCIGAAVTSSYLTKLPVERVQTMFRRTKDTIQTNYRHILDERRETGCEFYLRLSVLSV